MTFAKDDLIKVLGDEYNKKKKKIASMDSLMDMRTKATARDQGRENLATHSSTATCVLLYHVVRVSRRNQAESIRRVLHLRAQGRAHLAKGS